MSEKRSACIINASLEDRGGANCLKDCSGKTVGLRLSWVIWFCISISLVQHGGFCLPLYPPCRELKRGHSTVQIHGVFALSFPQFPGVSLFLSDNPVPGGGGKGVGISSFPIHSLALFSHYLEMSLRRAGSLQKENGKLGYCLIFTHRNRIWNPRNHHLLFFWVFGDSWIEQLNPLVIQHSRVQPC